MIIYAVRQVDFHYSDSKHQDLFLYEEMAIGYCQGLNSEYPYDVYEVVEVYVEE